MTNSNEIERLYRLDYGAIGEFWFRMIGTLFGALIIWLYTDWWFSWLWFGSYASLTAAFFIFLRAKLTGATRVDVFLAHIFFPMLLASYVWMPILMIASPDSVLSNSGFCILSGIIVFIVRRSEEHLTMMLVEIGILAVFLLAAVVVIVSRYDDPVAWIGLSFGAGTLIFYLTQGAIIVRRQRLRADEIAARTSQAEKLESIGKLAGGVAHDFNNILTAILGNLDLMKEISDVEERNELLAEAREATMRGAGVVRQLLTYARQSEEKPTDLESTGILRSVEGLCRTLVPANASLHVHLSHEELYVHTDEALLIAAILNLIRNGLDALDGSGQLIVEVNRRFLGQRLKCLAGQYLAPGVYAEYSVTDTGHGIPSMNLSRVVDPFFTTKAVGKGSGLGLSMVAGFAIKSGGGLNILSGPAGTKASIILPLVNV